MISHRGFSAWVTSEGETLRTFEPTIDNSENKISCWIAGEEGKTFTVHWRDHGGGVDTAAYIYLDGYLVPGKFLFGNGDAERSGARVGKETERPFKFAKQEPTEKGSVKGSPKNANKKAEVGTITLKIKRVKRTNPHPPNEAQSPPDAVKTGRRARNEPCIGFGPTRRTRVQHKSTWSFEPYDERNPGAYVTLAFRYRSTDFLMDQGIMSEDDSVVVLPEAPATQQPTPQASSPISPDLLTPSPTPSPIRLPIGRLASASSLVNYSQVSSQTNSNESLPSSQSSA